MNFFRCPTCRLCRFHCRIRARAASTMLDRRLCSPARMSLGFRRPSGHTWRVPTCWYRPCASCQFQHVVQPVKQRSQQQNSWETCLSSPSSSMPSQTAKLQSKVGHSSKTTLHTAVKCNKCPVLGRTCARSISPFLQISYSVDGVLWAGQDSGMELLPLSVGKAHRRRHRASQITQWDPHPKVKIVGSDCKVCVMGDFCSNRCSSEGRSR